MKQVISQSFAVSAQKPTVSIDHIDNYYLTEATGTQPAVSDSRWVLILEGQQTPTPTAAAPYLWHKSVTWLTDGTSLDPVVEFAGSLGQNGYDYDLVPSHSTILKAEDGTITPQNVSCSLIKRNADASAETQTSIPSGYSIKVYRDTTASDYTTLGSNVSTADVSVITFVLLYGTTEVERHDIRVITEGAEGVAGRGIQSQDTRFQANSDGSVPATPTDDTSWNTWYSLANSGYSSTNRYLWRCVKTVYINGNDTTDTEYLVDGPTVWGQNGDDAYVFDLDNEMDSVPCDATGKVTRETQITLHATIYKGGTAVTAGIGAPAKTAVALAGVAPADPTTSQGVVTIAWTFPTTLTLSEERYVVTIPVTLEGRSEPFKALFTLNAPRSGAAGVSPTIYKVLPSAKSLAFSRDSSTDALTPTSYSLYCGYSKNYDGNISTVANQTGGIFDTSYRIFYRYLNSGSWSGWYVYSGTLTISSGTAYTAYEFCVAKTTAATSVTDSNILDRETVPIIKSGQKGNAGNDAFTLDIDNEMTAIPVDETGKVTTQKVLSFNLQAYYGTSPVGSNCTISTVGTTPTGFTIDIATNPLQPKVTLAAGITPTEITNLTFRATHATYGTRDVIFTICAVKSNGKGDDAELYQLIPNYSAIEFARDSNGNLTGGPYQLTCKIQQTIGATTNEYTSLSGYYIYYGWNGASSPSTLWPSSLNITTTHAANYTNIVLELWHGQRTVSGSVRLDRETIPILRDGAKGGTGDDGNGIASVTHYRMFTQSFEAPAASDSGWTIETSTACPSEAELTKENRYLWEKKVTTYTKSSTNTVEIFLVAQFNSGICENLLENTAFLSEGQMEAWYLKEGDILENAVGAHNAFYLSPNLLLSLTEMLGQRVYKYGELQKLKANTWYTLSFWGSMTDNLTLLSSSVYNTSAGSYYEITDSKKGFYIAAGRSAIITVKGRCSSSLAYLRVYCYTVSSSGSWTNTAYVTITNTYDTTKSFKITNNQSSDKIFYVEGCVFKADGTKNSDSGTSYRCYMSSIRVDRGAKLMTCFSRSDNGQAVLASTSYPWYVNGKKVTKATTFDDGGGHNTYLDDGTYASVQDGTVAEFSQDGRMSWQLSPDVRKCSVTFKTPTSLASGVYCQVLFRFWCYSNDGWVSMPKLEENTIATEWIENTNDRMADDIQHQFEGQWTSGTTYYYGGGTGIRSVVRALKSLGGAYTYFRMKQRTTSAGYTSTTQPYNDTIHWELADYLKFLATDFLFAEGAILKFAQTNRILVYSASNVVAAGMGGAEGGENDYPLWVGATYEGRASAPFRVTLAGKMYASGCVISGDSTFAGTLSGVTGSFKSLGAIDSSGAVKASIGFDANTSRLYFDGDMQHQGHNSESDRSLRFLTSDLWCRGVFGARERATMVVRLGYAYAYTKGIGTAVNYFNLEYSTSTSGDKYYKIPCYSPGWATITDNSGFVVDTIIFISYSSTVYTYELDMADTQRVLLINGNDDLNNVQILQNGNKVTLNGGTVRFAIQLPADKIYPVPTSTWLGRGLVFGAVNDNNW